MNAEWTFYLSYAIPINLSVSFEYTDSCIFELRVPEKQLSTYPPEWWTTPITVIFHLWLAKGGDADSYCGWKNDDDDILQERKIVGLMRGVESKCEGNGEKKRERNREEVVSEGGEVRTPFISPSRLQSRHWCCFDSIRTSFLKRMETQPLYSITSYRFLMYVHISFFTFVGVFPNMNTNFIGIEVWIDPRWEPIQSVAVLWCCNYHCNETNS